DIAEEALRLIDVEYEVLPAVFDPEEAMKEGAPLIHKTPKNICHPVDLHFGDVEKGLKESDYVFEDRFSTQCVTASPLETTCTLAQWDVTGKLTIWRSTQGPYSPREELSQALNIPQGNIRMIKPHMGGGFGAKRESISIDFCAALLSKKTGRPVSIVHSREEEYMASRHRHPFIIYLKTGVKKDGTIVAKHAKVFSDTGAYKGKGPAVMTFAGGNFTLVYKLPNIRFEAYVMYTNNPISGGFRGFGNPQMRFADDSQLDMIAERLGIDPVEIRLRNINKPGTVTPNLWKITSCGLEECIRTVVEESQYKERKKLLKKNQGMGIAALGHGSGYKAYYPYDSSAATVRCNEDGTVVLMTGACDMGQGSNTILSQITAEALGARMEDIRLVATDTELAPMDLGAYGSRTTFIAGNAVKIAAEDARKKLFTAAAELLESSESDLSAKDGQIFVKGSPHISVTFSEAVIKSLSSHNKDGAIIGQGYYNTKTDLVDYKTGAGNLSPTYTFGSQVAKVEVDTETGEVKVLYVKAAQDAGVAINPMSVEGQIEGAVLQGVGYALKENLIHKEGVTINPNFLEYGLPTVMDSLPIKAVPVETVDPEGPFGAKGMGEAALIPTAPAIANAIYDAVGVRIYDLPITPDKVLAALRKKKGAESGGK
ncbi:MAG: molybdopterin cofactor-binding domain-containing protein, partial [Desulfatiglandales bacterium]